MSKALRERRMRALRRGTGSEPGRSNALENIEQRPSLIASNVVAGDGISVTARIPSVGEK